MTVSAEQAVRLRRLWHAGRGVLERLIVVAAAATLTLAFFLVLPLLQRLNPALEPDLSVTSIDSTLPPPPEPPPEPEEEEEEEDEELEDPDLTEDAPPLDLSQIEMAMNPGLGEGWFQGDFAVGLGGGGGGTDEVEEMFRASDLDQPARPIYQPSPDLDPREKARGPGQVIVRVLVGVNGRVQNARIESSSDPIFEQPVLDAIRQWKFEPGLRGGKPATSRVRQRFDIPKG